ncbi:MAG: nucleotidyltransferase domain-containing protein [Candidatus Thorarchaeota archaeon]
MLPEGRGLFNCWPRVYILVKSLSSQPIEGYFVVADEALVFEVKGVVHPADRLIAYLRYIPDNDGNRQSKDGTRFSKIYGLKDREQYLREKYPEYLWSDKKRGRVFQSVPFDCIDYVLSPIDGLRQLRDLGAHLTHLEEASRVLAQVFVEHARIDWSDIGLTGSQLVGLSTADSDIDLVVYGSGPSRRLHSVLKYDVDQLPGIRRYSDERLEKHVEFRWMTLSKWRSVLQVIESKKAFQGVFNSIDFFVRAVKLPREMDYRYEDLTVRSQGIQETRCLVIDDSNSIFTPCIYLVQCDESPDVKRLISYRGRFAEHASSGSYVRARGRLEVVDNNSSGESYHQLVLGENPEDYLLPV